MSHLNETLAKLQTKLADANARAAELELAFKRARIERDRLCGAIEVVKALDNPPPAAQGPLSSAAIDEASITSGKVTAGLAASRQQKDPETPAAGKRRAGRKGRASRYFGVTRGKPVSSQPGVTQFKAQVRIGGKYCYLGQLAGPAGELELAARVQDKIGNPAEAKRLRQMAADLTEQIENNPDRPASRRKQKDPSELPPPAAHKWECNKCGRDYVVKPGKCEHCGCEAFLRINADGSGMSDLRESPDE